MIKLPTHSPGLDHEMDANLSVDHAHFVTVLIRSMLGFNPQHLQIESIRKISSRVQSISVEAEFQPLQACSWPRVTHIIFNGLHVCCSFGKLHSGNFDQGISQSHQHDRQQPKKGFEFGLTRDSN
jgi:hypothetical protein